MKGQTAYLPVINCRDPEQDSSSRADSVISNFSASGLSIEPQRQLSRPVSSAAHCAHTAPIRTSPAPQKRVSKPQKLSNKAQLSRHHNASQPHVLLDRLRFVPQIPSFHPIAYQLNPKLMQTPGVAVRFWQLGLEMRPFFNKESLWVWPVFAGSGASFGYWLQGVDDRQQKILNQRKQRLLDKRARREEREAIVAAEMGS